MRRKVRKYSQEMSYRTELPNKDVEFQRQSKVISI